ncbi:hypothetical protein Syun_011948 [Stephania yunnanensis]|uniref:Uncharacterized protein n=1 Tax=Stephania yunnanensis TaxID=152371 RepID=A0AAP0JZT5_9MAGN
MLLSLSTQLTPVFPFSTDQTSWEPSLPSMTHLHMFGAKVTKSRSTRLVGLK